MLSYILVHILFEYKINDLIYIPEKLQTIHITLKIVIYHIRSVPPSTDIKVVNSYDFTLLATSGLKVCSDPLYDCGA